MTVSESDLKYKDEDWLRTEYVDRGRSADDIADGCGVTPPTVINWMERYGIERRGPGESQNVGKPYTDEDWLREKYVDEGLTMYRIAELTDCTAGAIHKWIHEFDIEPRSNDDWAGGRKNVNWEERATFLLNNHGYEMWQNNYQDGRDAIGVHRLAAVAWFGWDSVVDKEVHHRIPMGWLNIESNILPLPKQEHMIISGKYRTDGVPDEVVDDVIDGLGSES